MRILNRTLVAGVLMLVLFSQAIAAQPPGGHLNITQVLVDNSSNPTSLMIVGEDLDFGPGPLVVTLGSAGPITINSATGTLIDAEIAGPLTGGDYLLTVSMGNGQSQSDEYDLTIVAAAAAANHRTIRTEDTRAGCPDRSFPANTALITQKFTMASNGFVYVTGDIIRHTIRRADLHLHIDGNLIDRTLTYTSSPQWEDAHVVWTGPLPAGTHLVELKSPSRGVWGCGSAWGSIDTIIIE